MKRGFVILIGILALAALSGITAYFLTEPDQQGTKERTARFYAAAASGNFLADAIRKNLDFKTIAFGPCGHLDASPDSGATGSLIFSPSEGAFARYSDFDEFMRLNPKLLSQHEECRKISVHYMTIFPYQGVVGIDVDGKGKIITVHDSEFGN